MIVRFQQGGINLTVSDPRSAYNWFTLQSRGLDYLQIWSLSCRIEIQSCRLGERTAKGTDSFSGDFRRKRLRIPSRSYPGLLSVKQSIFISINKKMKSRNSTRQILKRFAFFKESVISVQFYTSHLSMKTSTDK